MALSDTALLTLVQAKEHLRINAAASLHISAEFIGVGDGSDVTFDLDHTPIDGSLKLYVDNALLVETTDYSISTATITFVVAPVLNKGITANYDYTAVDDTFESYDDLLLEGIIEAATKKAEEYTGRAFIQRAITESHAEDASKAIMLYKQPIVSVTSVVKVLSEFVGEGDGTTVKFTLEEIPASTISLYVDAVLQTLTTNYTMSDETITFGAAPADGAEITAKYTHTIKAISEYTEVSSSLVGSWDGLYTVVYTAGYEVTRAATQALVPDVAQAVLMIAANLFENRIDLVKSEGVAGMGSVAYDIPSQALALLKPYRTMESYGFS